MYVEYICVWISFFLIPQTCSTDSIMFIFMCFYCVVDCLIFGEDDKIAITESVVRVAQRLPFQFVVLDNFI